MRSLAIRGLVVGTFVGVVALGFAIAAAGAGHGTYIPAKLLFPFTMLSGVFGDSLTLPYLVVALVQFPLYGFILGRVLRSPHYRAYLVCLLCVHFAMVGVVLASNDSFAAAPRERPNRAMQLTASNLPFTLEVSAVASECCVASTEGSRQLIWCLVRRLSA